MQSPRTKSSDANVVSTWPEGVNVRRSICLITALTVADFIDPDIIAGAHSTTGAQLGVLTLAALLRQRGFEPTVIDLDSLFLDFVKNDQEPSFHTA